MSNPFAEHSGHSTDDLNDNPFADSDDKYLEPHEDYDKPTPQASVVSLPYQTEQMRTASAPARSSGRDETAARLEEIRRREQELAQRETNLGQREESFRRNGRNNWPPKPFWPFQPLIFHDIDLEIPQESRVIVNTLYRLWLALILTLTLNFVACILLLVTGAEAGGKDLGGSIVDLLVIPLAFLLWYRPAYSAYMKEASFYYYLYFIFNGFHIAFCLYSLIGLESTGSAGIINAIISFSRASYTTFAFCILSTIGWAIQVAGNAFMFRFVWKHHNDKGHTFAQAKSELQTHGIRAYFSRSTQV
ncbi:MAG: hypothetical protein CYPHOPRED_005108 [Cyphobasidiales sp. Tagirdzhanova-0007]|nr:MAG: hypothetical protein CYPHOPRED_005108 [Cyphobasidiales sp. Tagirdzhanova-0007]